MRRIVPAIVGFLLLGAFDRGVAQTPVPVATPATRTPAQDAAAAMGKSISNAQIADAIKNSGLTEAQVRARLQAAGLDAKLADPFFVRGGSGGPPSGVADSAFVNALQTLGIMGGATTPPETPAQKPSAEPPPPATIAIATVFGKNVFNGTSSAFDPLASGPVDPGYRLGIGDQLQLVISGEMEMALPVDIRHDGTVVLPQIGQVSIAGLTLEGARTVLTRRAAAVYSVISSGKAHLDLSVAHVRTNQVFVTGEVERPGSYQVSALGTVFRALAAAGGPTVRGTFRNVEVRRGGAIVGRIDLYDYLLRGDASSDIRTEQGDMIFVGLSKRLVVVQGQVRRPGTFELRDNEGFATLMDFAGGLLPTAVTDRIQIDRILPQAQRGPGKERALIDVPLTSTSAAPDMVKLYDSDVITVFAIGDLRRNHVTLAGEVFQPGTFEWTPGLTLGALINKAQGFRPWALTDRVKIERPIQHTGRSEIFSLNSADPSFAAFPIQEFDVITVLDGRVAYPAGKITIAGSVYAPGEKGYFENETLKDAIDVANGLQPWAVADQVIVTRTDPATARREQLSFDFRSAEAKQFLLRPFDDIQVLDARSTTLSTTVTVSGSVITPGVHPFVEHQTLNELMSISGGLRPQAVVLELASRKVGDHYTDTTAIVRSYRILADGHLSDGGDTVEVKRGDRINVRDNPGYRTTDAVTLSGLFTYPGEYVLRTDADRVSDIVKRAGGLLPSAYLGSGRLTRQGRPVAIELGKALEGDPVHDIRMVQGDLLQVGLDPSVVYVAGAVERAVVVPYRRGWGLEDYISAAGGYSADAETGNVIVEYPWGELRRRQNRRFFPSSDLPVVSGATITVGQKPDEKPGDGNDRFTRLAQITATLVSIFLAYKAAIH